VETPLIRLRKSEIVRLGLELSAPFHVTWSCYSGDEIACGTCESCILRLRAFAEAGYDDPIPYATNWKRTENVRLANVNAGANRSVDPASESSGNESSGQKSRGETHV
jgi:hypothetical protein